jgi:hypothetical protein
MSIGRGNSFLCENAYRIRRSEEVLNSRGVSGTLPSSRRLLDGHSKARVCSASRDVTPSRHDGRLRKTKGKAGHSLQWDLLTKLYIRLHRERPLRAHRVGHGVSVCHALLKTFTDSNSSCTVESKV